VEDRLAVLRELARLYEEIDGHPWTVGDRYITSEGAGTVARPEDVPQDALWVPDLDALLDLAAGGETTFSLSLAAGDPAQGNLQAREWVAEGGQGRQRRQGRGRSPWESLAAWLIAHRDRPL